MSKFCIIKLKNINAFEDKECLFQKIEEELSIHKLTCFEHKSESLIKEENTEYISLADSKEYDNCEMFLLPDGCFNNGETNSIPFSERMNIIKNLIIKVQPFVQSFEIFMGECASNKEDFIDLNCSLEEFPKIAEKRFYSKETFVLEELHFIINNIQTDSL